MRLVSAWFNTKTADSSQWLQRMGVWHLLCDWMACYRLRDTVQCTNPNSFWYSHSGNVVSWGIMTSITKLHKPKQKMTHDRPLVKCRTNQSPCRWWNSCWNIPWRRSTLCPLISGQWQSGHVIHVIMSCASGCSRCAVRNHNTLTDTTSTTPSTYLLRIHARALYYRHKQDKVCVWTISFFCACPIDICSVHLSPCPAFFWLSDTGSPCWDLPLLEKLRAYCISGHRGACPVPLAASHWYFSLSCSPLLLGQRVVFIIRSFGPVLPRNSLIGESHTFIGPSPSGQCSLQDYSCAYIQFMQLGWTLSLPTLSDCLVAVY